MRHPAHLALALLVLGCGSTTEPGMTVGPVNIEADAGPHRASETVAVTIANLSSQHLEFSVCGVQLERQASDGRWQRVYQDPKPCQAILQFLDGYASRRVMLSLPPALAAGAYRARFPSIGRRIGDEEPFLVATQLGGAFLVRP
ncbi:MAG: hypothetical protein ABJC36_07130 [Gemmatimonadales bacterium]